MREFREIEDVEEKLHVSGRVTFDEAREYMKKHNKSLEASMIEKDEASSETEFERTNREIREYIDAAEKSKELMEDLIETVNDLLSDILTGDLEKTSLKDCGTIQEWSIKMWFPQIRGIQIKSEEHFMKIIEREYPGVKKHKDFDKFTCQVGLHIKTIKEFYHKEKITYNELGEFAKKNNCPSSTIEGWVLKETKPKFYVLINEHALSKNEGMNLTSLMKERLKGLDSLEKLNVLLDHPHHKKNTKTIPSYLKDYENACGFYRFLEEIVDGGILSDVASRVGISRIEARRYVKDHRVPRLIRKVLNTPSESIKEHHEIKCIISKGEFEVLLERNPHLREIEDFEKMKHNTLAYIELKKMQREGTLPKITQEELAQQLGMASYSLNLYFSDKSQPKLLPMLEVHERARLGHEEKLGPNALEYRIDPLLVYENLKRFKELETISITDLASSIREILENSDASSKVKWVDLKPYAPTGQEWLRKIEDISFKLRPELETEVNEQLGLSDKFLRIGIVAHKLILRIQDTHETDWMKLFRDELFYFNNMETKGRLLSSAKNSLGFKGDTYFSQLVHQVTDYNKSITIQGINSDLQTLATHIHGATLSFILDSSGLSIQDIESEISFIGRSDRHVIRNPRFSLKPTEIDTTFARIFGGGLSDGHIDQFRVFCYCDASKERVEIFKKYVEFFGDVDYTEKYENGVFDLRYSCVIGRALEHRGFPVGDKTVQNVGLPKFIREGDFDIVTNYIKQLWAEDGHFIWKNSRPYFGWTRAVSLLDPEKDLKYDRSSEVTSELIEFIHKEGTFYERLGGILHPHYKISGGKLRRLKRSSDIRKARIADTFLDIIQRNEPQLMADEQGIMKNKLGVASTSTCTEVNHYVGTGRVSALWRARTIGKDDTMRVAIIAPPDDVQKNKNVVEWIESECERYSRISDELQSE